MQLQLAVVADVAVVVVVVVVVVVASVVAVHLGAERGRKRCEKGQRPCGILKALLCDGELR